jgi:NAD(P)-dependent dehydrogenase (short-subunit alcohol dehydrogenase family)
MGMVDYTRHLSCPAYKVSKYALNMLTVQWAQALEDKGFIVYVISPGVSWKPPVPFSPS